MRALQYKFLIVLMMLATGAPAIWAQTQSSQDQNQGNAPIPAYHSPLASAADNSEGSVPVTSELTPDTRSVTGIQDLSLGAPKTGHTYWQPRADVSGSFYSNFLNPTTNTGWTAWTSLSGAIDLHRISGNSNLILTYLGGASLSSDGGTSNGIVQQLGVVDRFTFRRYSIIVADQFGYLPEAAFGYSGLGSLISTTGGGNLGLQTGLSPNQSILTSQGQRISNAAFGEIDRYLTPRSSLTFVGSYGLLRFFDNNLLDSQEAIFQVGYNYQITRYDTIAVSYGFDAFRYSDGVQSINNNSFELHYARRVTGKLAFQIAGGPSVAFSNIAISGSTTPSGGTGSAPTKATQVFWVLDANATYQLRRAALTASYDHGVTGGSGVLAGSVTDNFTASVSRQFTRNVTASFSGGYSKNTGVALPTSSTPVETAAGQTYDYWFGSANLGRAWGRSKSLNVGYSVQYQTSNAPFCITTPCSTSYVVNQISFGLAWHPGPKVF